MADVKQGRRRTAHLSFKSFDADGFVEVTQWTNGEGYDVVVEEPHMKKVRFSISDFASDALIACLAGARVEVVGG